MKKISLFIFLSAAFIQSDAQDTAIQQYIGKYKFAAMEMEGIISIDNGELSASFPAGISVLKRVALDTFTSSMRGRESRIEFRRNETKKVIMMLIYFNDLILEGIKEN